ncbi:TadE family protein [Gimesia maris]|uniref:TadE family protein n=1 Tax=Gimesia maris TaxID=122 RepID=UPI0030DB39FA|tara:strand:- start:44656 stop:45096 length:441 start_codon:yes stop_codon:yes gene_type:complete
MQRLQLSKRRLLCSKSPRGTTLVEMAVVFPLFILLVFGLVEFVRMGMVKQALSDAARAGCRRAALTSTLTHEDAEATIRRFLQSAISNSQDVEKCRVTITPENLSGMTSGVEITARVEVNYSDISWLVPGFLQNTVLQGQAIMKRE